MSNVHAKQRPLLADRNVRIYTAWLFGATKQHLAEEWHLTPEAIRRIVKQVELSADERTRVALSDRLTEAGLMLLSEARELFLKPAPPITSGKDGAIVYDPETHEVARDYSAKIRAGEFMLKVIDRISKLAGADAPMQIQLETGANEEAQKQAEQVNARYGRLRVVS